MRVTAYRTTMPFTGGLSPVTDKVRKNQPQLGGGPHEKGRRDFDRNMGGDHKYIGNDPDGVNYAIGGPFRGEMETNEKDVSSGKMEIVVIDNRGREHVSEEEDINEVIREWKPKGYKLITHRLKATASSSIAPIVANIMPGCFKIQSESTRYGKREVGSCFAVGHGLFVTCAHAISKRSEDPADVSTFIVEGEKRYRAVAVDVDYNMDLAIISCDTVRHFPLPYKSISEIDVGDEIMCIGSPFGYDNDVSRGIVSSKGRMVDGIDSVSYFFIDLSVYPGSSGGPIVDLSDGKVVGVAAVIIDSVGNYGINAAIPFDYVLRRFNNLINKRG